MTLRSFLMRHATTVITSKWLRDRKRARHARLRKRSGLAPTVHYFHQSDDPYSHLAAQALGKIQSRYKVSLVSHLVSPPDDAAAPERERLKLYALRDAARVAKQYGFSFPANAGLPAAAPAHLAAQRLSAALVKSDFVNSAPVIGDALWTGDNDATRALPVADQDATDKAIADGDATRKKFGHYLSAMFYFEGEWYWGIDRLHHLEARLQAMGLDSAPKGTPSIAPYRDMKLGVAPASKTQPVIEYWFSFRSPYSWISAPRMRQLAKHYGCELRLRFILPMVMRGLPVPQVKRMYITLDTKREADCVNLRYGTIVDPVGPGAARALAVLNHAIRLGHGEEFAELGMRAAFADGIDLASDKGMIDVAKRSGLSEAQTRAALADESWKAIAEENREALFAAGLWGAPTFRVDGKPAHWGQDRFWALEEDILSAIAERNSR
ncbi:MAG: DsbA family protein [Parvibaculaceae bacterium]